VRTAGEGLPRGVLLLAVLCAFSFGAVVRIALADNYHTACVGHGFASGSSPTDGSFFSRVETGCSSTYRECALYTSGSYIGSQVTPDSTTLCNAWSRDYGNYTECASSAHVSDPGVFSAHTHNAAPGWCG
jgi:hypothetical protein